MRGLVLGGNVIRDRRRVCFICNGGPTDVADKGGVKRQEGEVFAR